MSVHSAFAWGWTEDGRCGLGEAVATEVKAQAFPRPVAGLGISKNERPARCAAGWRHTLFVLASGRVAACGAGPDGELGSGLPAVPGVADRAEHRAARRRRLRHEPSALTLSDEFEAADVAAGDGTSFALSRLGELFAWGRGRYGALGLDDGDACHGSPVAIFEDIRVRRVACGRWHCVALAENNQLYAWGRNHAGQLGLGMVSEAARSPAIVELEPGARRQPTARDIGAGEAHTVAIADTPRAKESVVRAYAWGDSGDSRLGDVDPAKHHTPQTVRSLEKILCRLQTTLAPAPARGAPAIVACGKAHTLVLTKFGQLVAWGSGAYGQLGYGDLWDRDDCVLVPNLTSVVAFAAGDRHSLAVSGLSTGSDVGSSSRDGAVYAWGFNSYGELGLGHSDVRLQPTLVRALAGGRALACAAGSRHTVVLLSGHAKTFRDDDRYRPALEALALPGGFLNYNEIRADLERRGLDARALDSPGDLVPDQPGLASTTHFPRPLYDPPLRYCLDSVPPPADDDATKLPAKRLSYETVYACAPCGLERVCRACVRRCHAHHRVEPSFVRWKPSRDRCDCLDSGRCRIAWSPERDAFDRLSDETNLEPVVVETIDINRHFRRLLDILQPDGTLTEEDYDAGEVALQIAGGTTTWDLFDRWYTPYFAEKAREAQVLREFEDV